MNSTNEKSEEKGAEKRNSENSKNDIETISCLIIWKRVKDFNNSQSAVVYHGLFQCQVAIKGDGIAIGLQRRERLVLSHGAHQLRE